MAKSGIVFNRNAIRELAQALHDPIMERAEAIADACNEESAWGGYEFDDASGEWPRARVWSADSRADEARDNRLIRNLDAGS